ncbi:MAG: SMP-30/gluconolactonase/LRE family protein, partial [Mesorhizobium sp.]
MHKTQATLILDTRDVVGESMVWDERRSRLVWVDIIGRRIHLLDPVSGAHETWPTPDLVTSIGLRQDGGAIVGLRKEIALWDFGGPFRRIATIDPDRPDTRLNEGVVAPDGRFVTADTMKNALYSYRWDRKASRLAERLPFFTGFERGLPDGSCLDAQGYVWNCRVVGGSCLARIGPEGRLDGIVELPCSWPTSCAFGGAGLDTLFVTSARFT